MSAALCIALAAGNLLQVLPSAMVTVSWMHTVEKTAWEEDYVVEERQLRLLEARVKSSGAGMDAPRHAVWSEGWWTYQPVLDRMPQVVLANSEFAGGYTICPLRAACRPLEEVFRKGTAVRLIVHDCASPAGG